jgi:hypothetical protein
VADILSLLAAEAGNLVEPLTRAAPSERGRRELLAALGWDLDTLTGYPVDEFVSEAARIGESAEHLAQLAASPHDDIAAVGTLLAGIGELFEAIRRLEDLAREPNVQLPSQVVDALASIGESLAEFLVAEYLLRYHPLAYELARSLTLLRASGDYGGTYTPPIGGGEGEPLYRLPATPPQFRLERLPRLVANPLAALREDYLDSRALSTEESARAVAADIFASLAPLLSVLGARVSNGGQAAVAKQLDPFRTLEFQFSLPDSEEDVDLGALVHVVSDAEETAGVVVAPTGWVQRRWEGRSWAMTVESSGQIAEFAIRRDGVVLPPNTAALDVGMTLEHFRPRSSEPWVIGSPTGTRLELGTVRLAALLGLAANRRNVGLALEIGDSAIAVGGKDGDGFLNRVLPPEGVSAPFAFSLAWSEEHGLTFEGSGALDVSLAVQTTIGPLTVQSAHLSVGTGDGSLSLIASATADVQLGPIRATITRTGLEGVLEFPQGGGNLGPAALDLHFRPPTGVGLSIDAGAVTGGGFLLFDAKNKQYAGALHLEFERLTLNAIGLLTTRMPDGSSGFSLLVIVQASGFTPIQLGFGFTLSGVGGLLGVNRTVVVDVLRTGIRNKTLDSILFSEDDPTPRAPQIVSTLQSVFPPATNQYAFGPMAVIGWGTPTLLTIEIALILELPSPVRLIVLGRLRAALPDPEHAIVSINLDVLGVIDFDRGELSVDASLYDSRVGPFALTGDMAARASWGATPDFAMALGGFHPAYKPPPGFPELRRLALALSTGSNPRVRMEAYFALTSNTVQVGARLELYVKAAGFSLEGGLGFDTLIQFSPFRLLAEIYARLALKRGATTLMGLDIHVHLIGPAPWVLWGEASFKLLFISIPIPFRVTIGRAEEPPALAREAVWEKLREQLIAPESWAAQLPPAGDQLVVLRGEAKGGEVLAHPLGRLSVSQRVVPLERTLEMFGAAPPKDYDRFDIEGAQGLEIEGKTSDYFAPAQFRRMRDEEKLTSPSFERMVSGVRLSAEGAAQFGHVQETPLDYEQSVILDIEQPEPERLAERYAPDGAAVAALAEHGPAGTAEVRDQGRAKFAPDEPGPKVAEPAYVVAKKDALERVSPDGLDGTYTGAVERLRTRPDRDELQVVREEEVELV